jgi:1-acyl-sn-glycerol-3-phosphate acyltransferase
MTSISRREWRGVENLPPEGVGCVVAANHISYLDPLVFAHFLFDNGRAPRMLAKAEILDSPIVGPLLRQCGQIPVHRETRDAEAALRSAYEAVERGECVGIYPEATLTRDPDLWPMRGKSGAARIALHTKCPVIPVGHWGVQHILEPYGKILKVFPRRTVHVHAGPPVPLDDLYDQQTTFEVLNEATDRIMAAITDLVAGIRGETPPATRFDPVAAGVPTTGNPHRRRSA